MIKMNDGTIDAVKEGVRMAFSDEFGRYIDGVAGSVRQGVFDALETDNVYDAIKMGTYKAIKEHLEEHGLNISR